MSIREKKCLNMNVWYDSGWSRGMPTYSSMLNVMTSWGVSCHSWGVSGRPQPGLSLSQSSCPRHSRSLDSGSPESSGKKLAHLEGHLALLVQLDEAAVHGQRRGASRKAEDEVRVVLGGAELVDAADDVVGDVGADLLLRVADGETHCVCCAAAVEREGERWRSSETREGGGVRRLKRLALGWLLRRGLRLARGDEGGVESRPAQYIAPAYELAPAHR